MRFVSKSSGYSICYKRDKTNYFGDGNSQTIQELWNCQFRPVGVLSHEIAQAKAQLINHGTQVELDGVTTANFDYRYGIFDTNEFQEQHAEEGFDDAERLKMEEFLLKKQDEYYRVVETVVLAKPWPNYDEFRGVRGTPTALRIAERVLEDGYDVDSVVAYERANANRQDVIDALEALQTAEPVLEEDLVSA